MVSGVSFPRELKTQLKCFQNMNVRSSKLEPLFLCLLLVSAFHFCCAVIAAFHVDVSHACFFFNFFQHRSFAQQAITNTDGSTVPHASPTMEAASPKRGLLVQTESTGEWAAFQSHGTALSSRGMLC